MGLLSRKVTTPYIRPHRTEPEWFRVNPHTACACIPPLLLWVAGAGHKDHPRCCPFMDEVVTYPQVQVYLQSISLDSLSGAYLPSLQPGQTFMAQTDTRAPSSSESGQRRSKSHFGISGVPLALPRAGTWAHAILV